MVLSEFVYQMSKKGMHSIQSQLKTGGDVAFVDDLGCISFETVSNLCQGSFNVAVEGHQSVGVFLRAEWDVECWFNVDTFVDKIFSVGDFLLHRVGFLYGHRYTLH